MLAGINAIKLTVIHRDVVNVTGARHELHHLTDLTCLDVVFDEAWSVTLIAGGTFLLMSSHLPDEAVVIGDAVQPEAWHARRREHVIDLPSLGIDADQRIKAVSLYPDFAGVSLPRHAVGGAAIVFGPEWNLAMADLLAVHVGLEYPINRRGGVLYFRGAIGPAPDITVGETHTAGVLGVGHHRVEELAVPVDEPGSLPFVVMALFLNPETSLLIVVDVDCIGPSGWRKKQLGSLRHPFRYWLAARASPQAAAERVGPRTPRPRRSSF